MIYVHTNMSSNVQMLHLRSQFIVMEAVQLAKQAHYRQSDIWYCFVYNK